jgi:hypothetical protein
VDEDYGMLDVGGLQRLTNMHVDESAQVRTRQTAPRANGQAGQPSIIYVSGAASRYERGSNPEQELQARIAEAEAEVRRLHGQAMVVNGNAGSPTQRLGEHVVYYREPEPQHIYDVRPARSSSPPRAPSGTAPANAARQRQYQPALVQLRLDSTPLNESAVQRVTKAVQELMKGFKPNTTDSLDTVDDKLRAATLRLPTETKGDTYFGVLIVAAGIPVDAGAATRQRKRLCAGWSWTRSTRSSSRLRSGPSSSRYPKATSTPVPLCSLRRTSCSTTRCFRPSMTQHASSS